MFKNLLIKGVFIMFIACTNFSQNKKDAFKNREKCKSNDLKKSFKI